MPVGCSWRSHQKWERVVKLGHAHAAICRNVIARDARLSPYHYVETYAGPGVYGPTDGHGEERGQFVGQEGSPLLMLRILRDSGLDWRAHLSDRDEGVMLRLHACVAGDSRISVNHLDCREAVDRLIKSKVDMRVGLAFFDPNGLADWQAIWDFAGHFKYMDILINVHANVIKRVRKSTHPSHKAQQEWLGTASENIVRVGRAHHFIWAPPKNDDQQFALSYSTGLGDFPEFRRAEFHRLESDEGRRIARRLDLTKKELGGRDGDFLPFMGDD